jgi:hypothetical protein
MPYDAKILLSLYRTMVTIRKFETLAGEVICLLLIGPPDLSTYP